MERASLGGPSRPCPKGVVEDRHQDGGAHGSGRRHRGAQQCTTGAISSRRAQRETLSGHGTKQPAFLQKGKQIRCALGDIILRRSAGSVKRLNRASNWVVNFISWKFTFDNFANISKTIKFRNEIEF